MKKKARKQSEQLLENKSREIFQINCDIEEQCSALLVRTTELELFHELAAFIQKDISTEEALQYFINIVCKKFDWPIAHVYVKDKHSRSAIKSLNIWYVSQPDKYNAFKKLTESTIMINKQGGLAGKVFSTNQSIWLDNVHDSELCNRKLACEAIQSGFAVPISTYGRVIAVAEFFTEKSLSCDENFLHIIETAALQLSTVLERRLSEKQTMKNYVELYDTVEKLHKTQSQLVQSEKLASVGQLAAGVAHEINNPIGFVSSNLRALSEYISAFKTIVGMYEHTMDNLQFEVEDISRLKKKSEELDIEFIKEDVNQLLEDSLDGMERVKDIIVGLKNFSRVDNSEMNAVDINAVDINACLQSTLKMLNNELKYKAEVITDLKPLPLFHGNTGKLNQVFTNLLVNAGHAIESQGCITVKTLFENNHIVITISDTGKGIKEGHLNSLFDPFFTTKPVGEGTGLGLSISYGIVQEHQGEIRVDSTIGEGTTFTVSFPHTGEGNR